MFYAQSTNQTFNIALDGDTNGVQCDEHLRQRCVLQFHNVTAAMVTFGVHFEGNIVTNEVRYYTDPNGDAEIAIRDILTDLLRKGETSTMMYVYSYTNYDDVNVADGTVVTLNLYDGISYANLNAPRAKDVADATLQAPSLILPPNVMINPNSYFAGGGPGILVESNLGTFDVRYSWNGAQVVSGAQLSVTAGTRTFYIEQNKTPVKQYDLLDYPACADLACIQWISLTGVKRRHFFPIVSFIRGNGDEVAVEVVSDGYKVLKENYTGFRCRLTGLTAWGYYYYMDLIQSSEVHAQVCKTAIDTEFLEIDEDITLAYVKADSMETPVGPGFFNFEFVVNHKQYRI